MQYWVIHPKANGECVVHLETILDTYVQPSDEWVPVACTDERPVQLLKETRAPSGATTRHLQRVDSEYEWADTASLCMCAEALSGWRHVKGRAHRTKVDWAIEVADRLRT